MTKRAKFALSVAAMVAAAGTAAAQPLKMEYDVDALGPGMYEYSFTVTVDDSLGTFTPGMGWNWLNFGSGQRSPTIPTSPSFQVTDPINFGEPPAGTPVGPWWQISSVGGGHNGPQFGPVSVQNPGGGWDPNFWFPQAVGETLEWTGTTSVYVEEGNLTWATVTTTGGASTVSRRAATRVPAGPIGSCCLADGSCIEVSSMGCSNVGGVYGGDNTTCAAATCTPPTGACCRDNGCVVTNQVLCTNQGGSYMGDNTECATAGCSPVAPFILTPPDFTAESRVWTYSPAYSQTISGANFNATGIRIAAHADRALEGQQNDILVEIVAPDNTTLLLGGDGTNPLVPDSVRWPDIRTDGSGPAGNGNPASFNGTYSWDFGPADGDWTVNFWNNYATTGGNPVQSEIYWNNISIEVLDLGAGACCMSDGTCVETARGSCEFEGGIYQGDGTECGNVTCTSFLATNTSPRFSMSSSGGGIFLDLSAQTDLQVVQIDYSATVAANNPTELEVWTRSGSYVGWDADPSAWSLHETLLGVSAGGGNMTSRELTNPIEILQNETVGVYLIARDGGIRAEIGEQFWSNNDLSLFSDLQRSAPWAGNTATRVFGGRIYYTTDLEPPCYANCDGSTTEPVLTVNDFTCFINEFASAQTLPPSQQIEHYANCDGSSTEPVLTVNDFTCFINAFAQGCP